MTAAKLGVAGRISAATRDSFRVHGGRVRNGATQRPSSEPHVPATRLPLRQSLPRLASIVARCPSPRGGAGRRTAPLTLLFVDQRRCSGNLQRCLATVFCAMWQPGHAHHDNERNLDSTLLRNGTRTAQITPAKPNTPPASNSQSGLSRVSEAATAAPMVTMAATQVRSEASPRTRPLAAINPIDSGTSAA